MRKDIILCGVGGQGTVLASRLISTAAMAKGLPVMSAETIGMAQRGGSVFSHVRIGEGVFSPMIAADEADLILAFEPGEAVRMLPYLREDGCMIVSDRAVMPVTASLAGTNYRGEEMTGFLREHVRKLTVLDAEKALRETGSMKVLNLVLLGAAVKEDALGLSREDLAEAIKARIPERLWDVNFRALDWAAEN